MPSSEILIHLENAQRIKFRLGKHFALKVPVIEQGSRAQVDFPIGQCAIDGREVVLHITCAAVDQERLDVLQDIISSHLRLMARQPLLPIEWVRLGADLPGALPDAACEKEKAT